MQGVASSDNEFALLSARRIPTHINQADRDRLTVDSMIWLLWAVLCIQQAVAASTAIGTSAIVSVYAVTSYSLTSSIVGSTTSQIFAGASCSTTTIGGTPTSFCVSGVAITQVPVYDRNSVPIVTTITSTVGYSTIYSEIPSPSSVQGPTQTPTSVSSSAASIQASQTTAIQSSISGTTVTQSSTSTTTNSSSKTSDASSSLNTSTGNTESTNYGLSAGIKAAIALAVILGVVIAAVIAFFAIKRYRRRRKTSEMEQDYAHTGTAMGKAELAGQDLYTTTSSSGGFEAHGNQLYEAYGVPVNSVHTHGNVGANGTQSHGTVNQAETMQPHRYEMDSTPAYGMGTSAKPV